MRSSGVCSSMGCRRLCCRSVCCSRDGIRSAESAVWASRMQATNLRKSMVVLFNGDLCKVMEFHHHTPGNLRAMVQVKLRNLRTGNQFEHRFRSQDEIEQAFIIQHEMEYMYSDGHAHHFMNTENYEQVEISEDDLGHSSECLYQQHKPHAQLCEGYPLGCD